MNTSDLPKTRAEAKAVGATHYFTGMPCKHGHIAPRKLKGNCVDCLKIEWKSNAEKRVEYFQQYNKSDAGKEAKQRYYETHKEDVIARAVATPSEIKNIYRKRWKEQNTLQVLADNKVRRKKHRLATPPWLTRKQKGEIRALYQAAILSSKISGEKYVIDHIYPLRSDEVCGLHVPWNLRIITRKENLEKSNTVPSDRDALAFPPHK